METEAQVRAKFLNQGPWIKKGRKAWATIGKRPEGTATAKAVKKKQDHLTELLRPHWEDEISYDEGVIRDSFDEALTVYQLYELAVETGYILLEDIRDQVREELAGLMWSEGARRYLYHYSYTGVAYLAQRVGVDLGFKEAELPDISTGTEGHFASFLSQHALWYGDKILDGWIGFLDDYLVIGDVDETDKDIFWDFLTTKQRKFDDERALWGFVAGADRLVTRLSELSETLSESEKPSYGMFYAYWMAKLYGYDLTKRGFVRDREQVDWAAALSQSKRIQHQLTRVTEELEKMGKKTGERSAVDLFRERDRTVREFWDITTKQFTTDPIQFR